MNIDNLIDLDIFLSILNRATLIIRVEIRCRYVCMTRSHNSHLKRCIKGYSFQISRLQGTKQRYSILLTDRQQTVRIGATLSDWKFLKKGVPQGIELGMILSFSQTIFQLIGTRKLSLWMTRLPQKYYPRTLSVCSVRPSLTFTIFLWITHETKPN